MTPLAQLDDYRGGVTHAMPVASLALAVVRPLMTTGLLFVVSFAVQAQGPELDSVAAQVPEPGMLALLGLALIGVAMIAKRFRARAAPDTDE